MTTHTHTHADTHTAHPHTHMQTSVETAMACILFGGRGRCRKDFRVEKGLLRENPAPHGVQPLPHVCATNYSQLFEPEFPLVFFSVSAKRAVDWLRISMVINYGG